MDLILLSARWATYGASRASITSDAAYASRTSCNDVVRRTARATRAFGIAIASSATSTTEASRASCVNDVDYAASCASVASEGSWI